MTSVTAIGQPQRDQLLRAMGYEPYRLRRVADGDSAVPSSAVRWVAVMGKDEVSGSAESQLLANIFRAIDVPDRGWQRQAAGSRSAPKGEVHWLVFGDPPPELSPTADLVRAAPLAELLHDPGAKRALWRELRLFLRRNAG